MGGTPFTSVQNFSSLKNHLAKCLYTAGKLFPYVNPGPRNRDELGRPLNESSYLYRCSVSGCSEAFSSKEYTISYKVLALHTATQHGVLEKILSEEKTEEAKTLLQHLKGSNDQKTVPPLRVKPSILENP